MGATVTQLIEWECIRTEENFQNRLIQTPHFIDEEIVTQKSKMASNLLIVT